MSQPSRPRYATRRDFMAATLWSGGALVLGCSGEEILAWGGPLRGPYAGARFVGIVPFKKRRRSSSERLEVVYGAGRMGRFRQDLTLLGEDTLITPNDRFYIRSSCPDRIDFSKPWQLEVGGLVRESRKLDVATVLDRASDLGVHLLECSGNGGSFGLISAARWDGIPLLRYLEEVGIEGQSDRVLVSGFDDHSTDEPMMEPQFGASWVFSLEQLAARGAFLATAMNGEPLPRDHGYPVRLVVPGWYGCTCIKWVNEIRFVDETEPATAQMREYAGRTHQSGIHDLAVDYAPAAIDLCAMPVRVERWEHDGAPVYRVTGVIWGGEKTTDRLMVQFGDAAFVPVEDYDHRSNNTWTLWSHMWKPERAGEHAIRMRVDDDSIRTQRLDNEHYRRAVEIEVV